MIAQKVAEHWDRIRSGTIETIDKFTDQDLSFVAFAGGYSVGEIIRHIAHEEYGEIQYGLTRTLDSFPAQVGDGKYETVEALKDLLAVTHAETIGYVLSLSDPEATQSFEAQWGENKPLIEFIVHVMEHEIHHRGELSLILGLLGREGLDA